MQPRDIKIRAKNIPQLLSPCILYAIRISLDRQTPAAIV